MSWKLNLLLFSTNHKVLPIIKGLEEIMGKNDVRLCLCTTMDSSIYQWMVYKDFGFTVTVSFSFNTILLTLYTAMWGVMIWGNHMTVTCMRVSLCHKYNDIVNITNIISRTSSPLLIYLDVGNPLRVTCEWCNVLPKENTNCKNMKMLQNCFACYYQFNWSKHICIMYIHGIRSHVTVIGFPWIFHAAC